MHVCVCGEGGGAEIVFHRKSIVISHKTQLILTSGVKKQMDNHISQLLSESHFTRREVTV